MIPLLPLATLRQCRRQPFETSRAKTDRNDRDQSFKIQKSTPIIDQIDTVLAKYYGFTDEELDFIINYDIKYPWAPRPIRTKSSIWKV